MLFHESSHLLARPKMFTKVSSYSTQHALLNLINKWHSWLDNYGVVGTILMDLSKAFDCLPNELVLVKLHAYGVDIKSLKLLQDFLSNRTQRVKLDSTYSSQSKILLGVPQSSILGPLLFNIFLNDILRFAQKTDICNFADASTIYSYAGIRKTTTRKIPTRQTPPWKIPTQKIPTWNIPTHVFKYSQLSF